jgi:ribose-phosphate pyrophosphokinase
MKVFSGRSNLKLSKRITDSLGIPLGQVEIKDFSDGEIYVAFKENIRNEDVFIIQSTNPPANNIIELLLMLDAAKRASARKVIAVIPYFGYARQDRKDRARVPISSKLILDMIIAAGVDRIITMDLHSPQIQGFINIPFDHLYSRITLLDEIKKMNLNENSGVVLAPDVGSAAMSQSYAKKAGLGFALIDKRRTGHNKAEVANLIGDLDGKHAIIIDDMIDTAGTTHPVLSGPAVERLSESMLSKVIATDTISLDESKLFDKLELISIADVFGQAIKHIVDGTSLSSMFKL